MHWRSGALQVRRGVHFLAVKSVHEVAVAWWEISLGIQGFMRPPCNAAFHDERSPDNFVSQQTCSFVSPRSPGPSCFSLTHKPSRRLWRRFPRIIRSWQRHHSLRRSTLRPNQHTTNPLTPNPYPHNRLQHRKSRLPLLRNLIPFRPRPNRSQIRRSLRRSRKPLQRRPLDFRQRAREHLPHGKFQHHPARSTGVLLRPRRTEVGDDSATNECVGYVFKNRIPGYG